MIFKKINPACTSLFFLLFLVFLTFLTPMVAEETEDFVDYNGEFLMNDYADFFTEEQVQKLEQKLQEMSERLDMDIVVVTAQGIGDYSAEAVADDFFDYYGYGKNEDRDGVLLLLVIGDRKWHISTSGYGITAFTDRGLEYIERHLVPYLQRGEYYEAIQYFAHISDTIIHKAHEGKPFSPWVKPIPLYWIFISLVVGLVLAQIKIENMENKLKSVALKMQASDYADQESLTFSEQKDRFLYQTTTKVALPKDSGSGSGGYRSGGSSTHTSSSGRSHGGRGGSW